MTDIMFLVKTSHSNYSNVEIRGLKYAEINITTEACVYLYRRHNKCVKREGGSQRLHIYLGAIPTLCTFVGGEGAK